MNILHVLLVSYQCVFETRASTLTQPRLIAELTSAEPAGLSCFATSVASVFSQVGS